MALTQRAWAPRRASERRMRGGRGARPLTWKRWLIYIGPSASNRTAARLRPVRRRTGMSRPAARESTVRPGVPVPLGFSAQRACDGLPVRPDRDLERLDHATAEHQLGRDRLEREHRLSAAGRRDRRVALRVEPSPAGRSGLGHRGTRGPDERVSMNRTVANIRSYVEASPCAVHRPRRSLGSGARAVR
jgi:hypothetical protein